MKKRVRPILLAGLGALLIPALATAWWNDQWASRKQLVVDGGVTGADIQETLNDFPLLVRLHTGNFSFFGELAENGKDIRFFSDDKTALKHHIEKVDAVNEMALLWLKVPAVRGGVSTDSLWMYYGNAEAADGSDANGSYDVNQALVYHFAEGQPMPQDATAYGNHAADSRVTIDPAGWIGAAAKFDGAGFITVKASPSLELHPDSGWTFSAWVRIDSDQQSGVLFLAQDGPNMIDLSVKGSAVIARYSGPHNDDAKTAPVNLQPGKWQHLALIARNRQLELYLDGQPAGKAGIDLVAMTPTLFIGGADTRQKLIGLLDEIQIANKARSPDWIKLSFRTQSSDFNVLGFGEDESKGSGGNNYFVIILQSLTVDGWVVIALCGVMLVISLMVMATKGLALSRAHRDNQAFLDQYRSLGDAERDTLDREETPDEREIGDSDLLAALVGKHDHFQGSPIYRVYHAGMQEMKKRFGGTAEKTLTPEGLNVIRARLDTAVVREGQRLNRNMVLLTIAISGGPFLGLLGTVMGVMITFATIAATGDVNINSIAPGISGALAATVAGLSVAIPALFAYNYLLTRIKDVTADMRVFTDEFLATISERIADQQRQLPGSEVVRPGRGTASDAPTPADSYRGFAALREMAPDREGSPARSSSTDPRAPQAEA